MKYPEEILRERIAALQADLAQARQAERQAILDWIDSCYWSESHYVYEIRRGINEGKHTK